MKALVYDYAIDFIGGGQRIACIVAQILSENYEVDFISKISNKKIFKTRFGVDFSKVNLIPPVDDISSLTKNYDLFWNAECAHWINPQAKQNYMYAHEPYILENISKENYVDKYKKVFVNCKFMKTIADENLKIDSEVLYCFPQIIDIKNVQKRNQIIVLGRIWPDNKMHQIEAIETFLEIKSNWDLILVGGTIKSDRNNFINYLNETYVKKNKHIKIFTDLSNYQIHYLLEESKIIWSLKGLMETENIRKEALGLSLLEGVKHNCIPLGYNDGGYKETLPDELRYNSLAELRDKTQIIINYHDTFLNKFNTQINDINKKFSYELFKEKLKEVIKNE